MKPKNVGSSVRSSEPSGRATGTPNRTLLIASLATLATFLDTTILFVAFPDIAATFTDTSAGQLSWVLNAYTIGFAALLIPAGKLADRIGHRRVFLAGSAVFTIASMACGLAANAELLIAFRVIQAAGAAALIPSSLALVMHAFTREQLPRAVAIWGAAGAVAGALGPTLGATIVETLGWRWAFFINLPVGIYTVAAGRRHLQESSNIIAMLIMHQRRTSAPVLDLELFRIRNFVWANLAMLVFGTAFSAMFLGSILFLTQVWGWSILQAGFGVAVGPIVVGLVAPRVGALAGRIGQRPILLIGGALYASSGAYRLLMLGPNPDYLRDYLPSMLLSGVGVGMVFPQLSSVVAQALPPNRRGVGGAALQAGRQFGGTFGVALTVAFLSAATGLSASLIAFDRIWWLIALGGLATTALALPLLTSGVTAEADPQAARE